jgi:hypothetical protein
MKASVRNIIFFVCGVIASLILTLFVISPTLTDISQLNAQVTAQKTEVLTLDQQILAFRSAQSDLSKAVRKSEITSVISVKEDLTAAVLDLERAMNLSQISDHLLQIKEQTDPKVAKPPPVISGHVAIEEIPYMLSFTTSYLGVLNALAYLEHLPHFTEIFQIDLSAETLSGPGGEATHTGQVFANFSGVFFIRPQP